MSKVSVLLVNYKTPGLTLAAVRSALRIPEVSQVIVIDNGSGDGTAASARQLPDSRVMVVALQSNVGFGTAMNHGATSAKSEVLCLLNSDAELSRQALVRMRDHVIAMDGRCVIGPRLVDADGRIQASASLLPRPSDLVVRSLGFSKLAEAIGRLPGLHQLVRSSRLAREYGSAEAATGTISTTMVSGACFAIGREAFLELGGFDERFFLYFEDADLCRRALRAGMAIRYVPDAVVTHIGGASSSEDYHFGPRHARSMRQYLAKWYGPPGAALAVVLMFLRAVGFSVGAPRKAGRAWRAVAATVGFGGGA